MKKFNAILLIFFTVSLSALFVACSPSAVQEGSQVSFSYLVKDPQTQIVLMTGQKSDMLLDYTGTALFQLLNGAKIGETKTELLQDPLNQHNPELVYKQTTMVFEEMGVPADIGSVLELGGNPARVVNIVNENGIEQVVLDANPLEATSPLLWSFTITEIK